MALDYGTRVDAAVPNKKGFCQRKLGNFSAFENVIFSFYHFRTGEAVLGSCKNFKKGPQNIASFVQWKVCHLPKINFRLAMVL